MFNALYRSLLMVWRMFKNACLRPFRTLYARFRRATNVTRQASQIVPKVVKSVTTVKVKPKSRQDYVDAGPVYVAKSLIFIVIAVIIALWLLVQFVIWPWMESRWFTARLWMQEEKAETYSGKVQLYYDEEKQLLAFEGRLEEGKKTGKGAEYYESGLQAYVGAFEEDLYQGQGTQLDADGNVVYEGGFAQGLYQGEGKLYQDAKLVYEGEFDQGEYQGEGKLYQDEQLVYEGEFDQGERSGQGKAYSAGKLAYEGGFAQGLYSGSGKLYYPSGQLMAECLTFDAGQLNGTGVLYHENGQKKYEGSFAQDAYAGQGTLYDETGERTYYGGFEAGLQSGTGTEYYAGGRKKYEGGFVQGLYDGAGTLYNYDGTVLYTGGFAQGLYQGDGTLNLEGGYSVQGVFAAGQVSGRIRYYQGTDLLYEGELVNGNAQGEGVLYAGGNSVYTGSFANGFIDGFSLLDMDVQQLRETVFAGAQLLESEAERGFVIKNDAMDTAIFCNYGYDDAEIVVHRVYLYGNSLTSLFAGQAFSVPTDYLEVRQIEDVPLLIPGVAASAQVSHRCTRYAFEAYTMRIWTDEEGNVDLIEWRSMRDLATESGEESTDSEASMVDGLLEALGLGGSQGDGQSQGDSQSQEDSQSQGDGQTEGSDSTEPVIVEGVVA